MTRPFSKRAELEQAPFVSIKVNGSVLPHTIANNLSYVKITEEHGKKSSVEFEFQDVHFLTRSNYLITYMDKVEVSYGYIGELVTRKGYEVYTVNETLEGAGAKVRVKATQAGSLARRVSRRVFTKGTVLDVFDHIAGEHGMQLVSRGIKSEDFPLSPGFQRLAPGKSTESFAVSTEYTIAQTGETDASFLHRLAEDHGWLLTCHNDILEVSAPVGRKGAKLLTIVHDAADSDTQYVRVIRKKPKAKFLGSKTFKDSAGKDPESITIGGKQFKGQAKGSFVMFDKDGFTKMVERTFKSTVKAVETAASDTSSGFMATFAEAGNLVTKAIQDSASEYLNTFVGKMPHSLLPEGKAENAKLASMRRRGRKVYTAGQLKKIQVLLKQGYAKVHVFDPISMQQVGPKLAGAYTVRKVVHHFDGAKFSTLLELRARIASSGKPSTGTGGKGAGASKGEKDGQGKTNSGGGVSVFFDKDGYVFGLPFLGKMK